MPSAVISMTMKQTERIISELLFSYDHPIRDPLWKHIYVSPGIASLFYAPEMQQLSRIKQLGPTHLLYPGAVHTRQNHSLGVFHLSRQVMLSLLSSSSFSSCTPEGVRAFLAASLLHDMGHFPYTHSLKELPLKEHETLAAEMIDDSPDIRRILTDEIHTDPAMVAAVIDEDRPCGSGEIALYRAMLSGPLDPDKLDYLNRDAYFCGVPYGIQDIDYIISKLIWREDLSRPGIAAAGLGALENLIFSKYLMYRYVYWHRTVRCATAMVKRALYAGLSEGEILPEDLYHVNDDSLFSLCTESSFHPFRLMQDVQMRRLFSCCLEIPYQPDHRVHRKLEDLHFRSSLEQQLSLPGHPDSVIIDLPEPISFELNIPVSDDSRSQIFNPRTVSSLEQELRVIRVFVHPECRVPEAKLKEALNQE